MPPFAIAVLLVGAPATIALVLIAVFRRSLAGETSESWTSPSAPEK